MICKNACKFQLYVKGMDRLINVNEEFTSPENDEMKRLLKEHKIIIIGDENPIQDTIEETKPFIEKMDDSEKIKPKNKGRKKKSIEDIDTDNSIKEDDLK